MAVPHEDYTPEEASRQAGYDASFASARRRLMDLRFVAALRRRLASLDTQERSARLSKAQFLEQTPIKE